MDRTNLSMMAMLPCLPTAPNRGRIERLRHHPRNAAQKNCFPLSVITCLGFAPVFLIARFRKAQTSDAAGLCLKSAKPTTSREAWSTAIAIHQQNGHRCGLAKGGQDFQKPRLVGTTVKSTCQM